VTRVIFNNSFDVKKRVGLFFSCRGIKMYEKNAFFEQIYPTLFLQKNDKNFIVTKKYRKNGFYSVSVRVTRCTLFAKLRFAFSILDIFFLSIFENQNKSFTKSVHLVTLFFSTCYFFTLLL
jgi:hypothetical protein